MEQQPTTVPVWIEEIARKLYGDMRSEMLSQKQLEQTLIQITERANTLIARAADTLRGDQGFVQMALQRDCEEYLRKAWRC